MANTTNRRSEVKRGTIIALVILALIALIGGTYARYTSTVNSNATLDVAKWDVKFKKADDTEISSSNPVTFTVATSADVASGKIAPSYTATADAKVDLTGTEVSVDLTASITEADLVTAFGADVASRMNVKLKVNGTETTTATIRYADLSTTPVQNIQIIIEWTEDNTDSVNAADTVVGIAGGQKTIPVTLTATQHID